MTVIKIVGRADGEPAASGGMYVASMDFEAFEGRGSLKVTPHMEEAKQFPDAIAAMEYWRTISKKVPKRPDGKPNRPLTAYHVEIVGAELYVHRPYRVS